MKNNTKLLFKNKIKFYFQSLAWQGFAELLHQDPNELAVVFKNVEFLRKTVIPENGKEIKKEQFWTIYNVPIIYIFI